MPDLCKVNDLYTSLSDCLDVAGIKEVKVIKASEIDLAAINASPTTLAAQFDTANYTLKAAALPLISGGDGWQTLTHDAAGARRTATSPTGKAYWDIAISALRFQGFANTLTLAQFKRVNGIVTATLHQSGLIVIDGLTYDTDKAEIVIDNSLTKLKLGEVVEDSNVFDDEIGLHTILSIAGRTQHKGYKSLLAWNLFA
jgi:hypothetical protein